MIIWEQEFLEGCLLQSSLITALATLQKNENFQGPRTDILVHFASEQSGISLTGILSISGIDLGWWWRTPPFEPDEKHLQEFTACLE